MDRRIGNAKADIRSASEAGNEIATENGANGPNGSGHLMCRTPLWGLAGFVGCAYFAWISFAHVTHHEYEWPHDLWTAATYVVWIILLLGLSLDTQCLRERIFFVVLVINFVAGCTLTLWHNISPADVRSARIGTGGLWAVAALVSLTTLASAPELHRKVE
ncbi:MAG: hypothetical protein ABSB87_15280 [Terriglobales bacterium]|jgi:hypothetical protein